MTSTTKPSLRKKKNPEDADGYVAFKIACALSLHFNSKSYDAIRYNWKTRTNSPTVWGIMKTKPGQLSVYHSIEKHVGRNPQDILRFYLWVLGDYSRTHFLDSTSKLMMYSYINTNHNVLFADYDKYLTRVYNYSASAFKQDVNIIFDKLDEIIDLSPEPTGKKLMRYINEVETLSFSGASAFIEDFVAGGRFYENFSIQTLFVIDALFGTLDINAKFFSAEDSKSVMADTINKLILMRRFYTINTGKYQTEILNIVNKTI